MTTLVTLSLKKINNYIDWKLLLFLLFFLNVKLAVKVPAIIFIYLLRSDFRFNLSLRKSRISLFYALMIGIALINLIIGKNYERPNYMLVFSIGISSWMFCLLAMHQIKLSVENNAPPRYPLYANGIFHNQCCILVL